MEDSKNTTAETGTNNESSGASFPAPSARIKRMRGWLGVKSSGFSGGHADSFEPLLPGEGHSGWNR